MPRELNISTDEQPDARENLYLYEESKGYAFFLYQRGTLVSHHPKGIKALFDAAETEATKGFLLTPREDFHGLVEVEKVTSSGETTLSAMKVSDLRQQYGLSL
jgi:hypothetical protein